MFDKLFSLVSIFNAWRKFRLGKARKSDVMFFEYHFEDALFSLYEDIISGKYHHSSYEFFQIFDNKKRDIFKAEVRDRIIHQIIYDYLLSIYEPIFISDSYSSRRNKGHHKAVNALRYFIKLASSGNKERCYVLKCDIKKYFENVDKDILMEFISKKFECQKVMSVIREIVESYEGKGSNQIIKGIPLGNITSQIFANIYLHSLDKYVKEELKCIFYIRYNDDLAIVSNSYEDLAKIRDKIMDFVHKNLRLTIPLEKTSIRKVAWGIDFLGYVILPDAMILRDKTKGKMYANLSETNMYSYLGILKHCNSYNLRQKVIFKVSDVKGDLFCE